MIFTNPNYIKPNTKKYEKTHITRSSHLTVVPEPGTFALLAGLTGLVSVMLRRRR
ncbi:MULTISPECIES: PEP-CTERM sorting domain-containing protein [unclassified Lentimonas]|uniref:PEP-CTERM sorting domain-containing protein n=1 Tax=unclassified Lentimonas TaxID=2630993 RepID=UPI001389CE11